MLEWLYHMRPEESSEEEEGFGEGVPKSNFQLGHQEFTEERVSASLWSSVLAVFCGPELKGEETVTEIGSLIAIGIIGFQCSRGWEAVLLLSRDKGRVAVKGA